MSIHYLVIDDELKTLLEKFSGEHPEGSKEVLRLVLKTYLKLLDKSRRRGQDPFTTFQDLIERIVTGKVMPTARDKIDRLDGLIEEKSAPTAMESSRIMEEIREIKALLRQRMLSGVGSPQGVQEFAPTEPSKLLKLETHAVPQRKNYRDLRGERTQKKIGF